MDLYSIGELVIDFTPGNEPASYIRNPGREFCIYA